MKRLFLVGLAALLVDVAFAGDADPEMARHELRTVAEYPKPVREAILELLNQPELLKKLAIDKDLDKALKGQKPAVADAGRLVAKHPEVLKLLLEHPEAFAQAAKAYADDKKKVIDQFDQEEKDNDKAVDEWSLRLEGDQAATEQLQKAAAAYAKQPGTSALSTGFNASGDEVFVYSLPAPTFVNYVMSNADVYPALSNVMVSQWLSSKNSAAYDRAFHYWWKRYEAYFHDSLLRSDEHRVHRLMELARYDRMYSNVDVVHRYDKVVEHVKEFPYLNKLPKRDPKHKPLVLHHKPEHRDPHPLGKDPHKPVHTGRHVKVHHKPPSHEHHIHHAHASHHHHVQHHVAHKK